MNKQLTLDEESQKFKKDADQVLKDSGLLNLLSQYGEVHFVGGYQFNLMLSGDIDIHVYIKDFKEFNKEKLVEILNKLIRQYYFQAYKIDDLVKWPTPKYPYGYYLGLRTVPAGYEKRWKIDIWFVQEDSKDGQENFKRLTKMTEREREIILEFKNWRRENNLEFPSIFIYKAVIDEKIYNLDKFKEYLKTHSR